VAGLNAKPIFITNSPLQEAAFNIAESAGMMLIQGESSENFRIILHKSNRKLQQLSLPFLSDTLNTNLLDSETRLIEKNIDLKIISVLKEIESDSFVSYGIDKLSKNDIDEIAKTELEKVSPLILIDAKFLSLKAFKSYLNERLNITIYEFKEDNKLLGCCNFIDQSIGISKSISGTNRELFVLAHEYGHLILHNKLSIGQLTYNSFEDTVYSFRTNKHQLSNAKHWIEWQANYFASSLIMHPQIFLAGLYWCQQYLGLSRGEIYLDDQPQNVSNFLKLVNKLAYIFEVSKSSIRYKLQDMELINNQSRLKVMELKLIWASLGSNDLEKTNKVLR
jgi:Zn-dependent peptidase ImmA (M78 family)